MTSLPAENGKNAGFLLKLPFWSRKCLGLKEKGVSHCSPFSTECNKGMITVPCLEKKTAILFSFLSNLHIYEIKDTFGIEYPLKEMSLSA